ncbi:MAG: Gfo/Idh/MocA family oxidoreductase [Rhizobiaceae bacterium]|nr:Gfo/Idh/MocA family oxidoreductase [Rhizobiaceae bacterium]
MSEGEALMGGGRIRLGMVGGGEDAFIGVVHRIASRIDDHYAFVAGALSSTPEKSARSAAALGLDPARSYPDFVSMAKAEAARPDGIEAVSIVTPNHLHVPAAKAFLDAGIHVICDKPLAISLAEARELETVVARSGRILALTHTYTGYPLIRQARAMVDAGELGDIRIVKVEYAQDWLAEKIEDSGHKQAEWRSDPARSGAGGCIGDIGTHAFNLAGFVTGLEVAELCAEMTTFVPGRRLDDDVQILLRYANGARGSLWASQVAVGQENGLTLRVYGSKSSIEWHQTEPNRMIWSPLGRNMEIVSRNGAGANDASRRVARIPAGNPEGYLEAFATLYSEIAQAIKAARRGDRPPAGVVFPTLADGMDGLAFIEASIRSSQSGGTWTRL